MLTPETLKKLPAQVTPPPYCLEDVTAGIVHFGVGNFFRAHLAYYIDRVLALPGCQEWGIIGVGLRDGDRPLKKAQDFRAQDGLYSLNELRNDGESHMRVIGALRQYLVAPQEPEKVLAALSAKETKIVSLTITEGGYNIDERTGAFRVSAPAVKMDLADPQHPKTVFGYVVEGLRRRREAGLGGFTVLSCDNLRHNGDVSRKAFVGYARAVDPALAEWIEKNVTFPNAMVDRITPSVSPKTMAHLNAMSGLDDLQPVAAEEFTQWVVEDKFAAGRPPLEKVGVQLSHEVGAYEQVKIRMLNASHIIMSFSGVYLGLELIDQAVSEPKLRAFATSVLDKDVLPTLVGPKGVDLQAYKQKVFERFANPSVADQTARVSSDGASKVQVFWTETIRCALEQKRDVSRLAFALAMYLEMLRGHTEDEASYEINEPTFTPEDEALIHSDDLHAALALPAFDGWRDCVTPAFEEAIVAARRAIREKGLLNSLPV